jgi:hypothetical protein
VKLSNEKQKISHRHNISKTKRQILDAQKIPHRHIISKTQRQIVDAQNIPHRHNISKTQRQIIDAQKIPLSNSRQSGKQSPEGHNYYPPLITYSIYQM